MMVAGGWMVRSVESGRDDADDVAQTYSVALIFVPDSERYWVLEDE